MSFNVLQPGLVGYREVYSLQKELVSKRSSGEIEDTLILVQHPTVITIGRKGRKAEGNVLSDEKVLEQKGIKIIEIDRGGDVTLHCPGQLVCYPILDLRDYGRDVHGYMRNLEEVIIEVLKNYSIKAGRLKGFTGVWVGEKKIASIGIGVSRWITYHGVSLNVCPSIKHFSMINVCGMKEVKATSMNEILEEEISVEEVIPPIIDCFKEAFKREE